MSNVWLIFIFIEPSKTMNSFLKLRLVLEIKNVFSFLKTRFYLKRGCIKMHKHAWAENWQSSFLFHFAVCKKKNLGCNFLTLFAQKRSLAHHYFTFYMKINLSDIAFHMTWEEREYVCSSSGLVFPREPYFRASAFSQVQGPDQDPVFDTMPIVLFCFKFVQQSRSNFRIKAFT